ncbi:2Fe-2S iron-sulfur cluster-binding protein [Cohnella luojiensis]|uniref:2Fe-2S iron-sulfur cluster binding domain-containing protein n=1 Tax=Cohnella luojiensis TaxID=652876 RepID=A0A4Y8M4W5_9BACL|nr:2Fe-2S iron-sulfur cluster-binding protein [Cohnella luojiensis]TFE29979.1 2Fe-2S iron-sulfur cluster binding domain-containing protein [Cohnella luojiensis]
MTNQHVVTFLPEDRSASVRPGTTLLEASRRAGVAIRTRCGGVAGCLMCKVHVDDDQAENLKEPTPAETHKLGSLLTEGVRLSCQARTKGNVTVTVPEDPLKAAIRKKLAEQQEDDDWLK